MDNVLDAQLSCWNKRPPEERPLEVGELQVDGSSVPYSVPGTCEVSAKISDMVGRMTPHCSPRALSLVCAHREERTERSEHSECVMLEAVDTLPAS